MGKFAFIEDAKYRCCAAWFSGFMKQASRWLPIRCASSSMVRRRAVH